MDNNQILEFVGFVVHPVDRMVQRFPRFECAAEAEAHARESVVEHGITHAICWAIECGAFNKGTKCAHPIAVVRRDALDRIWTDVEEVRSVL